MNYSIEFSENVIKNTNIVSLISDYVILKQDGNNYVGTCPFDKKKLESLVVFPETNTFHCYECGIGGNAATFLMEKEHISFDQAIEKLAERNDIKITEDDLRVQDDVIKIRKLKSIYFDAAQFYASKLHSKEGEAALKYLIDRKLTNNTINKFQLGYAAGQGNGLYKYLSKKGYTQELMTEAGLIKVSDTGPYDFFRNRVMFPIFNAEGSVVAFSGRVLDDSKPKYLNSPESLIFNKGNTLYGMNFANRCQSDRLLVCEGQMDVISLHQAGFPYAVAPMGTAMTQAHIPFITKKAKTVILTSDSDLAGQKAMMRAIKHLSDTDVNVKVVDMTPYKDPDEFIKNMGRKAYEDRIKTAQDSDDFVIKHIASKYDLSDTEQKEKFLQAAVDAVLEINDRKIRNQQISRER